MDQVLLASLKAYRSALDVIVPSCGGLGPSTKFAETYNTFRETAAKALPDLAPSFPAPIRIHNGSVVDTTYKQMGQNVDVIIQLIENGRTPLSGRLRRDIEESQPRRSRE